MLLSLPEAFSSSPNLQVTFSLPSQSILLAFIASYDKCEGLENVENSQRYSAGLLSSQREENSITLTSFSFSLYYLGLLLIILLPDIEGRNPLEDLALSLPTSSHLKQSLYETNIFQRKEERLGFNKILSSYPAKLSQQENTKDLATALKLERHLFFLIPESKIA